MSEQAKIILFGVAVLGLILVYLRARTPTTVPDAFAQSGPHECPRCTGKGVVPTADGKATQGCPVCRGYCRVMAFVFTYTHFEPCKTCSATGFVTGPEKVRPDGTGRPGARVITQKCPVEACAWGWLITENKVAYARITPCPEDEPRLDQEDEG